MVFILLPLLYKVTVANEAETQVHKEEHLEDGDEVANWTSETSYREHSCKHMVERELSYYIAVVFWSKLVTDIN